MSESKLTKTASSATYSNRDDASRELIAEATFSFDGEGAVTNIDGGRVTDKSGLILATFNRNNSMPGCSVQFNVKDVTQMQEVIAEIGNFIDAASEEGGAA